MDMTNRTPIDIDFKVRNFPKVPKIRIALMLLFLGMVLGQYFG
jgi:hypothetical protein